jgi:hypothetical protein
MLRPSPCGAQINPTQNRHQFDGRQFGICSRVVFGDCSGGGVFLDAILEDGPLDDFHQ